MGFLEDYAALAVPGQTPQQSGAAQASLLTQWIIQQPGPLFAELRVQKPNFLTPGALLVSRYADVVQCLDDEDTFSVTPYGQATERDNAGPNFVLGMDYSPKYVHDISVLRLAVRWEDADGLSSFGAAAGQALIGAAQPAGTLEVSDGYGRLVGAQFVGSYFGTPGPDTATLMRWTRAVFQDIFFNFTQDAQVSTLGRQCSNELSGYLDGLIADAHKSDAPPADTVIGRLVALQCAPPAAFTNLEIRTNVSGCIVGVVDNILMGVVSALDVLLSQPDALSGVVAAAQADDDALMQRYVREALRFEPPAKLLVRVCLQDTVLAAGTDREVNVPAGQIVFAANSSAMMDETALNVPETFRLDRPEHDYLLFGWGRHQCLGKYLALTLIAGALKPLLCLPGLRRAAGADGTPQYEGPFPCRFVVDFDPPAAQST